MGPAETDNESIFAEKRTWIRYAGIFKAELHGELMQSGFQVLEIRPSHKRQGTVRVLNQKFGLPWHWLFTRFLGMILAPFLSADIFAHMLIAVARKPSTPLRATRVIE